MWNMEPPRTRFTHQDKIRNTVPRASIFARVQGESRGYRETPSNDIQKLSARSLTPAFTPAHEARAGGQATVDNAVFPLPTGVAPWRGSPSYSCLTPTSRPGLGYVAPSALYAMLTWELSAIPGNDKRRTLCVSQPPPPQRTKRAPVAPVHALMLR
jgi:hypothetical protein